MKLREWAESQSMESKTEEPREKPGCKISIGADGVQRRFIVTRPMECFKHRGSRHHDDLHVCERVKEVDRVTDTGLWALALPAGPRTSASCRYGEDGIKSKTASDGDASSPPSGFSTTASAFRNADYSAIHTGRGMIRCQLRTVPMPEPVLVYIKYKPSKKVEFYGQHMGYLFPCPTTISFLVGELRQGSGSSWWWEMVILDLVSWMSNKSFCFFFFLNRFALWEKPSWTMVGWSSI